MEEGTRSTFDEAPHRHSAFCGRSYGYVAPPAPAVYMDWSGVSPTVAAALGSFIRTKQIQPPTGLTWAPHETIDYVHRATVLWHERRHVHDLLGTTVGNHLVLSSLALTVHMFTQRDASRSLAVSTCPDYASLCARTRRLMEASALLCQLALTGTFVDGPSGGNATHALMLSFMEREPARLPYNDFLRVVAAVVSRFEPGSKAILDVALLVLAMLCEVPAEANDAHLLTILRVVASESMSPASAARELHEHAQRRWDRARRCVAALDSTTSPWFTRIEQDASAGTAGLRQLVSAVLDDFTMHARATQAWIVADPTAYTNPLAYTERQDEFVQPLAFKTEGDKIPGLTDPVAGLRYVNREVWTKFIYGLGPAINLALAPTEAPERALFRGWLTTHGADPAAFGL